MKSATLMQMKHYSKILCPKEKNGMEILLKKNEDCFPVQIPMYLCRYNPVLCRLCVSVHFAAQNTSKFIISKISWEGA